MCSKNANRFHYNTAAIFRSLRCFGKIKSEKAIDKSKKYVKIMSKCIEDIKRQHFVFSESRWLV